MRYTEDENAFMLLFAAKVREEPYYIGSLFTKLLIDAGYKEDDIRAVASTMLTCVETRTDYDI